VAAQAAVGRGRLPQGVGDDAEPGGHFGPRPPCSNTERRLAWEACLPAGWRRIVPVGSLSCSASCSADGGAVSQLEREFLAFLDLPARRWRNEAREERGRYWTGPGRDGLEVAYTRMPSTPTVTQVRKLWSERHGRRAAPLLLVAEHDGRTWVCGPLGENPPVVTRDVSQAERLAAAALSEPSRHFAVQFLARAMDTDPDDVPGLLNRGLLSSHELQTGVPSRPDWVAAVGRAQPLLHKADRDLVEGLGFDVEDRPKHAVLRIRSNGNARAVAVFLNETEQPDAPSDRYDRQTPVTYALNQADKDGLPFVMAVRGSNLRLYSTATSGAVGQRGRTETFVGLDLPLLPTDHAGYLPLLFSAEALADGGTFGEIAEASANFAVDLSARLRERVYTQVIPRLARAIANRAGATSETKADLDEHYRVAVTVLFRLLFIAYAEDSRLLPANHPAYAPHSLKSLARSQADAINASRDLGFDNPLTEQVEPDTDTSSTDLWDTCRNLFVAVDQGRPAWGVPVYNGGLFSTDPTVNPVGPIIDRLRLTNAEVGPALVALLVDKTPDSFVGPIDFRSLSVREFGTIYEGLLESELARADTDLTLTRDSKRGDVYAPAGDSDDIIVEAGGVYLHNKSGARKATGSYFTKPFAVQHLIDTAVLPTLDEHLQRVEALLDPGDEVGASELLFDFRVADIAMGSGHFLTSVVDALEARYATFLADRPIPHVTAMLETLRRAAHNNLGEIADTVDIETSALLRRLIARRCVYGVDINPISVELARVSMWIHTFVPGLPLSFLDHNLVVGDSLTGIGTIDEAMDELTESGMQTGLFDDPVRDALKAAEEPLKRLAATVDATTEDIEASRQAAADAREAVQPVADLFDLLVAHRLVEVGRPTITSLDDLPRADVQRAREVVDALSTAHFPVTFPEVFARERPGFDVLVGNPPWDKVRHEPQQFWVTRRPGLNLLNDQERDQEISRIRGLGGPDVDAEDEERAFRERMQRLFKRTFRLRGSYGHLEYAQLFLERTHSLVSPSGRIGLVLPRQSLVLAGWANLREALARRGDIMVAQGRNAKEWIFEDVHASYMVAFVSSFPDGNEALLIPEARSSEQLSRAPFRFRLDELRSLTDSIAIPWFASDDEVDIFVRMKAAPRLIDELGWVVGTHDARWDFRSSGPHRSLVMRSNKAADWKVLKARHVKQFELVTEGGYNQFASQADMQGARGLMVNWSAPRVILRHPSRNDDSRTLIATLLPPEGFIYCKGYVHSIDVSTHEPMVHLALLGYINTIVADWWARRLVDRHVTSPIVNNLRIPDWSPSEVATAARLAASLLTQVPAYAKDEHLRSFAANGDPAQLRGQLNALAMTGFNLTKDDLTVLLKDFSESGVPTAERKATHDALTHGESL